MSELRQRMNDAMVLRGFSARTKESYLACVTGLAKYYRRSPDTLDAAAIQTYLLYLITEKKLAYARARVGRIATPFCHPVCSNHCACTGELSGQSAGSFRIVPATARFTIRWSSGCIAPPATPPAYLQAAAFIPYVMPLPRICSKPASICTPSSACSGTATFRLRCAICIWRNPD